MVLERLAATGEIPEIRRVQAACKRRLSGTPAPGEPTGRCRVRALGRSRGKTEPSTGYFAAPLPCERRREGRFRKIRPTKGYPPGSPPERVYHAARRSVTRSLRTASGARERQCREPEEPPRDRAEPTLATPIGVEEPAIALHVRILIG